MVASRLTHQAAADGARLVVWHEGALASYPAPGHLPPFAAPPSLALAERVAKTDHVYLVAGLISVGRNEAVAIAPSGQILGTYGKQHPVTFIGDRSVPTPVPVYHTAVGPLATIICYDLDFVDTANEAAAHGAGIVAVPSQDWGRVAPLHYTHLVFRAVENDLTMDAQALQPWFAPGALVIGLLLYAIMLISAGGTGGRRVFRPLLVT